jgi:uncharacterized protein (DUF885 family)
MSSFAEFCERYFQRYFELHPTEAIYYGVPGYDHLLNDYSDDAFNGERAFVSDSLAGIRRIERVGLDADEAIDYDLLLGRLTILSYELAKEDFRLKQPDIYLPVDSIYILTVRPTSDFAGNLLRRLDRGPDVLRRGIENLSRTAANPPRLWTEMAIEGANGSGSFLDTLPGHPKVQAEIKDDAKLNASIQKLKAAIDDYSEFLKTELLPRSRGTYAVGEEHYNLLLKHKHFLTHEASSLLALGEALFETTKRELNALAEELGAGKGIEAITRSIQENHPALDEVLPAYRRAMAAAREFVKQTDLVSFPAREELHVVPTPEFRRHEIPFAAYLSPSPKDPGQVGYYYVTPVDDTDLLREHNWVGLENTSVHESYPGHHLQFSVANTIPAAASLPRLSNESSVFYEGWALYCEQLMQEQGFLKTREHRFVMLKDRLWRALRIIIDVKTQTGKMTYDEAAALMVRELQFPRAQACADLNWYSQSPSGPMGYALGWSMINRLRDREKTRLGGKFSLREFHDKLLSAGSISLPLVERRHFNQ